MNRLVPRLIGAPGHPRGRRLLFALVAVMATGLVMAACGGDTDPPVAEDRIIVSGASGQLGGLVVEELLSMGVAPERLILVSRTPEGLSEYAAMGASTRFGDFTQPESLSDAYAGGDRMLLISISVTGPERVELHRTAIDAAVQAGVEHIAYTSFVDLDNNSSPLAEDHRLTEAYLRDSGVAWTMLRNQLYMNGIVGQAAQMIEAGRVIVAPDDPGIGYAAREDCAAAAAAVLATSGHENVAYDITGPEVIGPRQIAQLVEEIVGVGIEVVEDAPAEGAPPPNPSFSVVSTAVSDLTGQPPMTARDMLEANRETLMAAVTP